MSSRIQKLAILTSSAALPLVLGHLAAVTTFLGFLRATP